MKQIGWLLLLLAGCQEAISVHPSSEIEPVPLASQFDPSSTGSIEGRITWEGAIPQVEPLIYQPVRIGLGPRLPEKRVFPNPNQPIIDASNHGIGNAVVFLRGIEPARSRPWDQVAVTVEMRDYQFHVQPHPAVVQRGQAVSMVSRQPVFHFLSADGASFFGLAFPEPDRPLSRRLDKTGVVELASGASYFWMRAYLFVDDHPYYSATDPKGRFRLEQVPAGTYEVVAWLPNWLEADRHHNPETAEVTRLYFRPPVELKQRVAVPPGQAATCDFRFALSSFAGP